MESPFLEMSERCLDVVHGEYVAGVVTVLLHWQLH